VHEGAGSSLASALVPGDDRADGIEMTARTCVVRAGDGVRITTTVPGQSPMTQTIVADGSPHDISDGECHGIERTEWSKNGTRLIAHADVKCSDQAPRTLTGLGLITRQGQWLDIRSFQIDGRDATRVSRYQRVSGARISGLPLSIDEIKEASTTVSSSVVEAAIAESRSTFTMNKRMLLDLADAHVAPNVIDVMIAVSFPDRFLVEKPFDQSQAGPYETSAPGVVSVDPPFDPFWPYYYYPSYYYSPFGYRYLGRYDPSYYGAIIYPGGGYPVGGGGGGSASPPPSTGFGRAVNGQGYTRIIPAESAEAQRVRAINNGSQAIVSRASAGSTSSAGSSSSPTPAPAPAPADSGSSTGGGGGGGGGGATASPQGFSGGGGDGGGRTAVPR
jgi:hypothetical protein